MMSKNYNMRLGIACVPRCIRGPHRIFLTLRMIMGLKSSDDRAHWLPCFSVPYQSFRAALRVGLAGNRVMIVWVGLEMAKCLEPRLRIDFSIE
jgi:hypothetical protein